MSIPAAMNETLVEMNGPLIGPAPGIVEGVENLMLFLFSLFTWGILLLIWFFGLVITMAIGSGAAFSISWVLGYKDDLKKTSDGKEQYGASGACPVGVGVTVILQIGLLIFLGCKENVGNLTLLGHSMITVVVLWGIAVVLTCVGVAIRKVFKAVTGRGEGESEAKTKEEAMLQDSV